MVIIAGMGSIVGSAIGAIIVGLTEQYGLVYSSTYGIGLYLYYYGDYFSSPSTRYYGKKLIKHRHLVSTPTIVTILLLIVFSFFANSFWLVQIGAQTFIYGIIALGLVLLAGYGGIISLAQITVAGFAGCMIAIFGVNSVGNGFEWALLFWVTLVATSLATIFGIIIGVISKRTKSIYTIMITLSIAAGFLFH